MSLDLFLFLKVQSLLLRDLLISGVTHGLDLFSLKVLDRMCFIGKMMKVGLIQHGLCIVEGFGFTLCGIRIDFFFKLIAVGFVT